MTTIKHGTKQAQKDAVKYSAEHVPAVGIINAGVSAFGKRATQLLSKVFTGKKKVHQINPTQLTPKGFPSFKMTVKGQKATRLKKLTK